MLTLNRADVFNAAKIAYLEGRLSAQSAEPVCEYRNSLGCPCAIGAAIPADSLIVAKYNDDNLQDLVDRGLVTTDDFDALNELQRVHDGWAGARTAPDGRSYDMRIKDESVLRSAEEFEAIFKEMVGA